MVLIDERKPTGGKGLPWFFLRRRLLLTRAGGARGAEIRPTAFTFPRPRTLDTIPGMKGLLKKLPPIRDLLSAGGCATLSIINENIDQKIVYAMASVAFLTYGWGRMLRLITGRSGPPPGGK